MEEYIVSARKYRPLSFDSVVGQRALTTTLKNAIGAGKLAHAYLFCGPRGVGKTTCARIFAKAINCLNPKGDGDACGECESCKAFNEQRSMNIHELDAASNNSVEDIRELCKQVQIPPQTGKYKVFIIDEVHMLSSAAFNAFLKTLEEPPSYVIFILATTEKHKILPTILSRCQVYDFQRMTTQNTIDHLMYVAQKEGYTAEPEALNLIAQKADGGMRDALSIFDQMVSFTGGQLTYERVCQSLNVLSTEYYFRLVDHFLKAEVEPCLLLLNEVLLKGFDAGNFIAGLATHLRDLLVSRDAQTLPLLEMSEQMKARYQEQAQRCQPRFLYRAIKLCNDCDQAYRTSRNKRLQVEICLIQAAQLNEEDVPSSGLCPEKILKPIFKQSETKSEAAPVPAPAATTAPSSTPQPVAPTTKPQAAATSTKFPLKKVTFKHYGAKKAEEAAPQQQEQLPEEHLVTPIQADELLKTWNTFIAQLPTEQIAMAQRMRTMNPQVQDTSGILLTVNSKQVADSLKEFLPQITTFMRKSLRNCEATIDVRIVEVQEVKHIFNKNELFLHMKQQNEGVERLASKLSLVVD